MDLRGQDKGLEMPTSTLAYNPPNRDSSASSKLSSPTLAATIGERSDHNQSSQTHTIFNNPPQTSEHHHLSNPPPPPPSNPIQQSERPRRDPDPSSSPIATTTSLTSTPIVGGSNPRAAPPPAPQIGAIISGPLVRYRECLKNHAASMGGNVVDGCGEFMPGGEEGTQEALRCAACECHRNFHRKETEGEPQHAHNYYSYYPSKSNGQNRIPSPQFAPVPSSLHQHPRISSHPPSAGLVPPMMVAFGGGGGGGPAESSSEDLNMFQSNMGGQLSEQPKKRFRTKFTQEQRDRMMEFAEKLGWKIQKHDEEEVHQFCAQVGVKREVFKVWMHNHKQALKKKQM